MTYNNLFLVEKAIWSKGRAREQSKRLNCLDNKRSCFQGQVRPAMHAYCRGGHVIQSHQSCVGHCCSCAAHLSTAARPRAWRVRESACPVPVPSPGSGGFQAWRGLYTPDWGWLCSHGDGTSLPAPAHPGSNGRETKGDEETRTIFLAPGRQDYTSRTNI